MALFGATAGQGVVWYTGQFYALYFMQTVLKIDFLVANQVVAVALALGTPFFIFFGWLSDRVGRKPIMMAGMISAAFCYLPIYSAMVHYAGFNGTASVNPNVPALTMLILIQVLFVTMVYGPIAAFLVELFPTRVRYTSMSLPYHIGNGVFGGLVPLIGTSLVAATGSIYAGLIYPISIAFATFFIGVWRLPDTKDRKLWDES